MDLKFRDAIYSLSKGGETKCFIALQAHQPSEIS